MACYSPLDGYRSKHVNPLTGKRSIVFSMKEGVYGTGQRIPCGQCIGCRLEKSRQWAMRCCHEASMWEKNSFVTLTYRDEELREDRSLEYEDVVRFMKRLRKRFGAGIRSYGCGEYGEKFGRPHFHLCLFNLGFEDRKLWKENNGMKIYTSEALEEEWGHGFTTVGELTFESAAYVARYVTKKITNKNERIDKNGKIWVAKEEHYKGREPEKACCISRRPGIGKSWFEKFESDVFPGDFIVMREKKMKPPGYYDRLYEIKMPSDFAFIKERRRVNAEARAVGITQKRLSVMEEVKEIECKTLMRPYETESLHSLGQ